MAGSEGSLPPTRRLEELRDELDEQERKMGLPPLGYGRHTEASSLLEAGRAALRAMTQEEVAENAVLLQQYAFYLQRHHNRCVLVSEWCEQNIRHVIAGEVGRVRGWSLEERRPLAVRGSETARQLTALKVKADANAADVAHLANRAELLARFFENYSRVKGKQHG